MRITVSLDADLIEEIRAIAKSQSVTFKTALNDIVRSGLAAERRRRVPFKQMTRPMGAKVDLTHALQMAADLEDEENIRKLQLGK